MNKIIKKDTNEELILNKDFINLLSRWEDGDFLVINEEKLKSLIKDMPTINKKTLMVGNQNSQTQRKVASLQMLYPATATYQVIKEILALIEQKRMALKESYFKREESKLKLQEKELDIEIQNKKIDKLRTEDEDLYELEKEKVELKKKQLELDIVKLKSDIADSNLYIENAIKEIGYLNSAYKEIVKNKKIKEFDEMDYEKEEFKARVEMVFRQAFRDLLVTGRIGMGTLEGFETIGVHPVTGINVASRYYNDVMKKFEEGKTLTYKDFMKWLESLGEEFKDNYKEIYEVMGIDTAIDPDYVFSKVKP